ncbi:MAG: hypothetical protein AAF384_19845, partial [Pseudomonadota bacterium]
MGLLDDLKKEADQKKAADAEAAKKAQASDETLRALIGPNIKKSYKYLGDLIEQLKVIDKDIEVDFNMPEIGNLKRMKQDEYVIGRIDA